MEQLKAMKSQLTSIVQSQLGDIKHTDAKELGEVVDMIKDLSESIYYCKITEAMEKNDKESEKMEKMYYTPDYKIMPDYRDMGRMYYTSSRNDSNNSRGGNQMMYIPRNGEYYTRQNGGSTLRNTSYYNDYERPLEMRDMREGRSPMSRKMYMEGKEMHHDKSAQIEELDKYLQELSHDITEMIEDASPEEKQLLQQKISTLATKIK